METSTYSIQTPSQHDIVRAPPPLAPPRMESRYLDAALEALFFVSRASHLFFLMDFCPVAIWGRRDGDDSSWGCNYVVNCERVICVSFTSPFLLVTVNCQNRCCQSGDGPIFPFSPRDPNNKIFVEKRASKMKSLKKTKKKQAEVIMSKRGRSTLHFLLLPSVKLLDHVLVNPSARGLL